MIYFLGLTKANDFGLHKVGKTRRSLLSALGTLQVGLVISFS